MMWLNLVNLVKKKKVMRNELLSHYFAEIFEDRGLFFYYSQFYVVMQIRMQAGRSQRGQKAA